ncbi:MAG: STAS domain-containing protein [Betaproteobacteria bacterium]|nr:STAS domain-containing protein [Betaproteobacteria bacterium]
MTLRREGDRLLVDGPLGIETVPAVMREASAACRDGVRVVDLGGVSDVDSSALALALELMREANAADRKLAFENLPQAMEKLAQLYAVSDMFSGKRF